MSTDPRITKAKRAGADAVKRATEAHTKAIAGGVNRSTATRATYKTKAEGLDKVLEILGAKPGERRKSATSAKASTSAAKRRVAPRPKGGSKSRAKAGSRKR